MNEKIYLNSYDRYVDVLEIDIGESILKLIARQDLQSSMKISDLGYFTQENDDFFGVFPSESGPIFFKNSLMIPARMGHVDVKLKIDNTTKINHFSLFDDGKMVMDGFYKARDGLNVNPYDADLEDVDLFALMALVVKREEFFRNYKV